MNLDRIKHTIWGQQLQAQLLLGYSVALEPYTTLNEYLNVNKKKRLEENERPAVRYYCIGDGGHEMRTSTDVPHVPDPIDHDPTDAGLYNLMPFVMRRLNNDLTAEERKNYRLRVKREVNGVQYWAYYLKKMETEDMGRITLERVENGVTTYHPYASSEANLSPRKPQLSTRQVNTASNVKAKIGVNGVIHFTEQDVKEYLEVAKILYGSVQYAVVSEIGLVAGVDDNDFVSPDDASRYTEVKGATITTFLSTFRSLVFDREGFRERLELGEKEPLLVNSNVLATVGG